VAVLVPPSSEGKEAMSVLVAVTDSAEGLAALEAAANEAATLNVPLTAVNLTGSDLDTSKLANGVPVEVVVPTGGSDVDEVEQVLQAIEERSEVTRLVVGVRKRSPIGKAVLGSIAQRLILESSVPVLSVKTSDAETRS
jgi:K+-sensing histidine kinase KdpD